MCGVEKYSTKVRRRLRRGARVVTIELGESEERMDSEEESVTIAGEEETFGSLLSGLSRWEPFQDCRDLFKPNHHVELIMCSIEECATPIPSIFEECPSPPSCNLGQAPQKKQDKEDKDNSPSPPSYILRRQHREEEKQDEGSPSISPSSPVKTKSPVDAQSSFGVFDVVEDTGPGKFKLTP